jgi:hypothetical protein
MIRKIFTFIFLIAFAVHTFSKVVVVFGFYANQKTIAATLCENKDKPLLHCDGKCVLAKKIQQTQNKEQQQPESKASNKPTELSSRSFYSTMSWPALTGAKNSFGHEPAGKPVHRSFTVFHPPVAPVHIVHYC